MYYMLEVTIMVGCGFNDYKRLCEYVRTILATFAEKLHRNHDIY